MRRMASFSVTTKLIEDALCLPEEYKIKGAEWDWASETVRLILEGPDLPEVHSGCLLPNIIPVVTVTIGDDGRKIYVWDFGKQRGGGF